MAYEMKQVASPRMMNLSYLLWSSTFGLVIDPSFAGEKILDEANARHVQIVYVINTHGHFDHVNDNTRVRDATGAKIAVHEADSPMLDPSPDILLHDGECLHFGDGELRVIHTPGHTPGGICLHGEGNVFTGDTLFPGGFGRTDLDGGNWKELMNSIKKLGSLDPDTKVFPGHYYGSRRSSTIGEEMMNNPALSP